MSVVLELHALHTVPPSNLNRDDTGSPKTAIYGGVRRHRVSSQSWKRAIRQHFSTVLDTSDLGYRTKRIVELVANRIQKTSTDIDREQALHLAETVVKAAGLKVEEKKGKAETQALLFASDSQINRLAEIAVAAHSEDDFEKAVKERTPKKILQEKNSIDIALFGRMVASDKDLNVDAACQVSHAISTHAAEVEFDYFTAVDDFKTEGEAEDAGAGMIGTVEFTSSTLYRYANVNLDRLQDNLGNVDATARAAAALVESFVRAMPTGKANTFANNTLPDVVVITVRNDSPVNLVNAFESPVVSTDGYRVESVRRLVEATREVESSFVSAPKARYVIAADSSLLAITEGLGDRLSLTDAILQIDELVRSQVGDE